MVILVPIELQDQLSVSAWCDLVTDCEISIYDSDYFNASDPAIVDWFVNSAYLHSEEEGALVILPNVPVLRDLLISKIPSSHLSIIYPAVDIKDDDCIFGSCEERQSAVLDSIHFALEHELNRCVLNDLSCNLVAIIRDLYYFNKSDRTNSDVYVSDGCFHIPLIKNITDMFSWLEEHKDDPKFRRLIEYSLVE